MKVFKFGGASVKDAEGVINLVRVLENSKEQDLIIIVSAMGKMTNAFESIVHSYFYETLQLRDSVSFVVEYHEKVAQELFPNVGHKIHKTILDFFTDLKQFLQKNKSADHAFVYDQVVPFGEMLSTTLISAYLSEIGIENNWLDVRSCIVTDANYRDAKVDWDSTQKHIKSKVARKGITITQGFLGSEASHNFTTTLGREGSDYSAAIFAYCMDADSVTIWKDVPGVLNADPRHFAKTTLLNHISYREAIEMAFYGASVMHPKTLQPLQRKEIKLYVKSFLSPLDPGTCVGKGVTLDPMTSCFILKKNQVLISLSSLDFSFMMQDHIGDVFNWLHQYKMKVEMIQNSAISFSVCVDNRFDNLEALLAKLRSLFRVKWNENVSLYTVRHSVPKEITALSRGKTILLKQESRDTVQLVVKE